MLKCRGSKCREQLVKQYKIIPRSHTKLLNGQVKKSCTGDILIDSYYSFEYTSRVDSMDKGGFFCGSHATKHFLQLISHPGLAEFNPLSSFGKPTDSYLSSNSNKNKRWDPTAKELYNAINLLIICWDKPIYGKLAVIKEGLEKFPDKSSFCEKIKHVNAIISKDSRKRTLSTMLTELKKTNPTLKTYKFNLLNTELYDMKIPSNF
ncbi:hypothetical protein [Metabacillus sp. SLBN-84]